MKAQPGLCIVLAGQCVELLFLKGTSGTSEIWEARPLFVDPIGNVEVIIRAGQALKPIHSQQ